MFVIRLWGSLMKAVFFAAAILSLGVVPAKAEVPPPSTTLTVSSHDTASAAKITEDIKEGRCDASCLGRVSDVSAKAKLESMINAGLSGENCLKNLAISGQYNSLKAHTSLVTIRYIDGPMISDPATASEREVQEMKAWFPEVEKCKRVFFEDTVDSIPELQLWMIDAEIKSAAVVNDLASRKITWGQYNSRLVALATQGLPEVQKIIEPYAALAKLEGTQRIAPTQKPPLTATRSSGTQNVTQHTPEEITLSLAKQRARAEMGKQVVGGIFELGKLLLELAAVNAISQPKTTTCTSYGNTTTCF